MNYGVFVKKAKQKFENKFEYILIDKNLVEIVCPIHRIT